METITLEDARRVIAAAEEKAVEIGCPMDIAVVDVGGHLKSHVRMDGAFIGSIYVSLNSAYTAIAFQTETKALNSLTQSGQELFGLSEAHGGRLVNFAAGRGARGPARRARRPSLKLRLRHRRQHRDRRPGPGGGRSRRRGFLELSA